MRRARRFFNKLLTFLVFAVLVIGGGSYYLRDDASSVPIPESAEEARLLYVIDGDTLLVELEGIKEKVRLLGIDTPESVHPDSAKNSLDGVLASQYAKDLLAGVQYVFLEKDVTDRDRYGRLLRYVWISDDLSHPESQLMNAVMVKEGYAEVQDFPPDTKMSEFLHSLEPEKTS